MNEQRVVFFDGVCGLCNKFVDFVLRIDKKELFVFSPLQGELAAQSLPKKFIEDLDSIVVLIDGKTYRKSEAVFALFKELGFPWSPLALLGILPSGLSDWGYNLVASQRYRIFGQSDTCRLPAPNERSRFKS